MSPPRRARHLTPSPLPAVSVWHPGVAHADHDNQTHMTRHARDRQSHDVRLSLARLRTYDDGERVLLNVRLGEQHAVTDAMGERHLRAALAYTCAGARRTPCKRPGFSCMRVCVVCVVCVGTDGDGVDAGGRDLGAIERPALEGMRGLREGNERPSLVAVLAFEKELLPLAVPFIPAQQFQSFFVEWCVRCVRCVRRVRT